MTTGHVGRAERAPETLLDGEIGRPLPPSERSPRVADIVAAAHRLLEHEGPESLSMRRLAAQIGIRAPSLYKHFSGKADVELALVEDALFEIGDVSHRAIHEPGSEGQLVSLVTSYRRHSLAHPNLYRLATTGGLARGRLLRGLEEWAGNPWYVVTKDEHLAQALWSYAHGMVTLELDERYPPGSDLDRTWSAGAAAFERAARRAS